jgi:PAS domain S-box-containing protein
MTPETDLSSELTEARRRLAELEAPEAERRRAENVQAALYRIAELASAARDMQEFYRAVHSVVGELMNANNFFIALYDEERQLINWPYWADELDDDWPEANEWVEFGSHQAQGTTGYVLRTGEPQLLDYAKLMHLVAEGEIELVGVYVEDSSWIGVPLKAEGRTVGVLVVQSYTKDVQYNERDKELLAFVGQHIGAALSRARAIEETRQRNAELALINSVQEALAGELELQAIYDVVGDKLRDVFDAQVIDIAVYDGVAGLLHFPYSIERGVRYPDEPIELIGFRKHVMETREPLLIDEHVLEAAVRFGNPVLGSGEMPKSVLYLPLVATGKATGVISLQNFDREHAFTESDQQLLETLARSLSVALENARLMHETRQRNAELALINSVQEALAGELELQAIYDVVGDKIQEIFDAQVVDIGIFDFEAGLTRYPYTIERGVRFPDEPVPMMGSQTTQLLFETKAPVLINDVPAWEKERGVQLAVLQGEPSLSILVAPLTSGDELRGRISLQNLDRTNAFSENDVRLLTTLAGSLSVALENARLVHETRQRNAELALINSVQESIAGELDQQAIYDLVGDKLQEVFDAQVLSISICDEATGLQRFPYVIERGERFEVDPRPVGGFTKHVLESGEPLLVNENFAEIAERHSSSVLVGDAPKSALFVPLGGGKATGVISLQNVDREHAFSESDQRLLVTLAGSLSVALENARLVHETRQRNAELALINTVQESIAGELDQQAIYDVVGEKLREVFDAQVVDIAVHDEKEGILRFVYQIERGVHYPNVTLPVIGFRKHVLETREPLAILENMDAALVEYGNPQVVVGEPSHGSAMFQPLVVGGRATGVISIQNLDREHAFTESDRRLLATIAGSLGVALENAQLINETRQRVAELGTVNSVGQALASQLDLDALIQLVGDKLQEVFDADIVYVALHEEAAGRIDFAYYSEDAERQEQSSMEYGEGLTSRILRSREPLLLNRSEQWEEIATARVGTPSLSYLGVPIFVGEKAIGVVSVQSTREAGRFGESDARLLSTIAANVGSAIQNARLYRETRRRANETAALAELGREVSAMLDLTSVHGRIGERAQDLLEAETSVVYLADEDGETFRATIALGKNADEIKADTIRVGEGIIGDLAARGAAEVINDTGSDPRAMTIPGTSEEGAERLMAAPLLARERVIGMMAVWRYRGSQFTREDLSFLIGLSQQAAIAIENARLFEAQREAERQYRQLVEELPLAVYRDLPDESAASEYISPRVEALFGYPREAWSEPEFFASILHSEDRDETIAKHAAALARGDDRWSFEYRLIAADGRTVFVRDDAWIVKDEDGNPSHVQGFMIDVTDQARAHAEIRRQKQYFESLVEVSPVAIVVMDAEERVTGWNPAATVLFGWTAEEAVGRSIDELVFEQGRHSNESREVTRQALATGRAQRIGRRTRKDGAVVDVELMLVPLEVDGEHVGFYAIYHDITELQRAREEAEAATQAKSAFLATMSHEIRTPMNAVIGMSDLLLGTELTAEQREFAEVVRSSGDALLHVIDDILDYSKIEAGKLELERERFDLRECVEGALEIVAPRASDKEIELGCLIDEDAPAGIVGDAARLRQVLLNLLSNAVKFTERGEVVVHVDAEPAKRGLYRLELAVRDTGIGIPPERMDRLFTSFSQVDASTTRRYGGTGLGLAISKRLVELMGGTIRVESEQGKGSTFHISLTAKAVEVPRRVALDDALPRLTGKRVLVVDDNATNREIVSRHARSWDMEPVALELPSEALELIAAGERFDVAVLDMMMPDMDGISLANEIRRHRGGRELPLLLLTSLGRLPHARSTGAFAAQLAKPVRASQLYNALVRLVAAGVQEPETGDVGPDGKPVTSPLRILLAEDNAVNQKVALRLLERLGYRADVASNGLEAVAALERQPYDVVLMDVQMPELDGLEASRRICEQWPAGTRPRIIAMTANAMAEDRAACFAAGMDDYVAKPIRPNELAKALSRAKPSAATAEGRSNELGASFDAAAFENLRELGGDEFLAEVIDTFLEDAPTLLTTLRSSLGKEDSEELRRAAHTLKSNGATLGAERFSELCRELEQRARSGELDGTAELVDRIEREYDAVQEALAALRSAAIS